MIYIIDIFLISIIYYINTILFFLKKHPNLHVEKNIFKYSLLFVILILIFFLIFFRFLNLFRQKPVIDLFEIFNKVYQLNLIFVVLFVVFFFFFVKLFVFIFKLNFLKIHYFLMNKHNFKYNEFYINFIYFFVTWPNRLILFFLSKDIFLFQLYRKYFYYFFRYFFSLIMLVLFFIDIIINNCCLLYFTLLLPWYSLYQLLYNLNSFLYFDLEYLYDTVITDVLYPLDYKRVYRLYYEYPEHKSVFLPNKPEGYLLENDEYLIIRNYINKRLLI